MTYLIIALIAAILCALIFLGEVNQLNRQIRQLKHELSAVKNSEEYYKRMVDGFRDKMREEEEKYELVQADYCTSDSDYTKYSSQKAMGNAIRSKMAMLIGNEIAKRFEPRVLQLGDGKQEYSLVLKVKKI